MKASTARLTLIAALIAAAAQAQAADWGGIQNYRANPGVPVPAPVPIPEFKPSWYFRFDAGLGVVNEPDVSDDFVYGLDDGPGPVTGPGDPISSPSSWFDSDFDTFLTLGGGVGYYFGNGIRIDATVEKRSNDDAAINGSDEYARFRFFDHDGVALTDEVYTSDEDGNGIVDVRSRLTVDDRTQLDGTLWLANAYYDLGTVRGFTPYIGAGIGFAWNEITRSRTQTVETCDNEAGACAAGNNPGTYTNPVTVSASDKADKVTLAAAVMAGFSYNFTEMTSVDIGYRYLYVQGADAVLNIAGQDTRIEIGDQHVHQVRAGLRFDVE